MLQIRIFFGSTIHSHRLIGNNRFWRLRNYCTVSGCGLGDEEYLIVEIKNYGDVMVAGYPVSFQIDGGAIYTEMEIIPLDPGDSAINYFGIPIDLSEPGIYTICAWTNAPDDNPWNDSLCITIESLATPSVDLGPDLEICDAAILDAGNPGSDYAWSTGEATQTITADITGIYSVLVTEPSTGCIGGDTILITLLADPIAGFLYSADTLTFYFTNTSVNCDAYTWDFGDGSTSSEENPSHTYIEPGSYLISLSASNPCNTDVYSETITLVAVDEMQYNNMITMYPNPADDFISIHSTMNLSRISVQIINLFGQKLSEELSASQTSAIHLEEFSNGMYELIMFQNGLVIYADQFIISK